MDWLKSYSATWRIFRVNRQTWADAESIPGVVSVEVLKTADGDLIESGSMTITGDFQPDYYRIVMNAEQGGDEERVDVATLLFDKTGGEYDYGINTEDVDGFSVLYPASVTMVTDGEYAPKGVNGATYARDLLAGCINAPIEVDGAFILNDHIVHELGTPILDAVWSVLNAGGYVIQIDGKGIVYIRPKPVEASLVIDNSQRGLLLNGVTYKADVGAIPNRYIVIDGVNITIAENRDPRSEVSTVSRGYTVDVVDTSPATVDGETYGQYANRRLIESSILKEEREYSREYVPGIYPYSIIKATIDGLEGNLTIQSQSISCRHGISVSEKVAKEIKLYEG